MTLVVTCGDINGIGPEIAVKALAKRLNKKSRVKFILLMPADVFSAYSSSAGFSAPFEIIRPGSGFNNSSDLLTIIDIKQRRMNIGKPTRESGLAALSALEQARKLIIKGTANGIVTAPISKEAIIAAGSKFAGHTEMLASWFNTKDFTMFFYSRGLKGALLTIHVPLKKVSALITPGLLKRQFEVVFKFLSNDLMIPRPRIAYLGINPHAGENGIIGNEDNVIKKFVKNHSSCAGPFPADGYFGSAMYKDFNCTVAAYHDQLLIPFKLMNMSTGVNVTAGLPFVRTSPDHGTAFDIAGRNTADESSMLSAINLAEKICANRLRKGLLHE